MSFYKIADPTERRRMFEKLAQTRKNVQEQFLEDKIGKIESSASLKKFFKPITESQKEITKEIKEQLAPIKEKVLSLPFATTFSIKEAEEEVMEQFVKIGPIAVRNLSKYLNRKADVDRTFGPYTDEDGTWKIGDKEFKFDGDDLIVDEYIYPGTEGFWELVVENDPSNANYNVVDLQHYALLLVRTNAMRRYNDPTNPRPKSSKSMKWKTVIQNIWAQREELETGLAKQQEEEEEEAVEGTGTVVIPSDPNALLQRLDLLMASKEAGNTGTRNELVSICDELLRQKVISKNEYKNIMLRL